MTPAARRPRQPVAQNILFGDDESIGRGKAVLDRQYDQSNRFLGEMAYLVPAGTKGGAGDSVVAQQSEDSLPRSVAVTGDNGMAAAFRFGGQ